MNKLKFSSLVLRITSILASLALFALASWPARAEWTPESCYVKLTNSVATWNPNVPLKYFKVIHSDGSWGPALTNKASVLPMLYPGDNLCVKVDTRPPSGIKFTTAIKPGPMNPLVLQCHPTGSN